jgi:hypothetical protein
VDLIQVISTLAAGTSTNAVFRRNYDYSCTGSF